jgi:hypothetical protein
MKVKMLLILNFIFFYPVVAYSNDLNSIKNSYEFGLGTCYGAATSAYGRDITIPSQPIIEIMQSNLYRSEQLNPRLMQCISNMGNVNLDDAIVYTYSCMFDVYYEEDALFASGTLYGSMLTRDIYDKNEMDLVIGSLCFNYLN